MHVLEPIYENKQIAIEPGKWHFRGKSETTIGSQKNRISLSTSRNMVTLYQGSNS